MKALLLLSLVSFYVAPVRNFEAIESPAEAELNETVTLKTRISGSGGDTMAPVSCFNLPDEWTVGSAIYETVDDAGWSRTVTATKDTSTEADKAAYKTPEGYSWHCYAAPASTYVSERTYIEVGSLEVTATTAGRHTLRFAEEPNGSAEGYRTRILTVGTAEHWADRFARVLPNPITTGSGFGTLLFGNGQFITTDVDQYLISTDGYDWSTTAPLDVNKMPDAAFADGFYNIQYSYTAMPSSLFHSADLVSWTKVAEGMFPTGPILVAGDDGPRIIAYSSSSESWFSSDGVTWASSKVTAAGLTGLAFGNDVFLATTTDGKTLRSTDAFEWATIHDRSFQYLTFTEGRFVMYDAGTLYESADGTTYTTLATIPGIHGLVDVKGELLFFKGEALHSLDAFGNPVTHHIGVEMSFPQFAEGNGRLVATDQNSVYTATTPVMAEEPAVNAAPAPAQLVAPKDGATDVSTTTMVIWKESDDPEDDDVSYTVWYCEEKDFAGCSGETVTASNHAPLPGRLMEGLGMTLLAFGFVFIGRRKGGAVVVLLVLLGSTGLVSCGTEEAATIAAALEKKNQNDPVAEDEDELQQPGPGEKGLELTGLKPATTYYWKVVASDGDKESESDVWSFTTK